MISPLSCVRNEKLWSDGSGINLILLQVPKNHSRLLRNRRGFHLGITGGFPWNTRIGPGFIQIQISRNKS